MATFKLTTEQEKIVDAVLRGKSVLVHAYAGCSKTTTLVEAAKRLQATQPKRSCLFVAFNVRVKAELQDRLGETSNWKIMTLNGLGHRTLMINGKQWNNGAVKLTPGKSFSIARELLKNDKVHRTLATSIARKSEAGGRGRFDAVDLLAAVLDQAKMLGIRASALTPEGTGDLLESAIERTERDLTLTKRADIGALCRIVNAMLERNLGLARVEGVIDFNDQIYLSTRYCAHHGRPWDTVMVDEMQDLSPLNVEQIVPVTAQQLVAVGDPNQSIYQFRSGTAESIAILKGAWEDKSKVTMSRLPLHVTFRCPRAVVDRQQKIVGVKGFKAFKDNREGSVTIPYPSKKVAWSFKRLLDSMSALGEQHRGVCLARTNAELLLALALAMSEGLKARQVAYGGRIPSVQDLHVARSMMPYKAGTSPSGWEGALVYLSHLVSRRGYTAESLHALICKYARAEGDDRNAVNRSGYFDAPLTLSTIHGFKGLEADTVCMLNPRTGIGSTGNLRYIAETRTRNRLLGVSVLRHAAVKDYRTRSSMAAILGGGQE